MCTHPTSATNRYGKRRRSRRKEAGSELRRCPMTRKVSFASRAKTRERLLHSGVAQNSGKAIYKCPHCRYWHATSQGQCCPAVQNGGAR